jgi:ketol-acid reductoisomerase
MNYFNQLPFAAQLKQLRTNEFLGEMHFSKGLGALKNKKIVIIGCGSQGLNQGLNMRDSGLDVSYVLRKSSIERKNQSFKNAVDNNFKVGEFKELIPSADLVCNLTPDKYHSSVMDEVIPLMKTGATVSYSHGFNIVEQGYVVRKDLTVIMVAPKCPGTEVRQEYLSNFGVPTLIAVHIENDPQNKGLDEAKAYAFALGSHKAGVLQSSFIAEVKSDLMGEQTILCGVLQSASILCFDKMVDLGVSSEYASKLIQNGWETITEALKHGGVTNMMDRLSNPAKIEAFQLSEELKGIMFPLFQKHMNNILSGDFSERMMNDWGNDDAELLKWREATGKTNFELTQATENHIEEQAYFDHCTLLVAFVKSGVELAFEIMTDAGIGKSSAYYESLHELPLIANLISRKKLYEMNKIISDTAEYGCYLFDHECRPLLSDFMAKVNTSQLGASFSNSNQVNNLDLIAVNSAIRSHPIETVGKELREKMQLD